MSEEQRRQLQQQLWNIANTLRGKMNADEFRDYILGFIFYKYLSEKIQRFGDSVLEADGLKFAELKENTSDGAELVEAVHDAAISELGYFLKPSELFHAIAMKGSNQLDAEHAGDSHNFILGDLTRILKNIEQSTLGTDSADDFSNLFEDMDLTSSKLGATEKAKNELVAKVLVHLDKIDFNLSETNADVLGDAYEYLIGEFASGAGKKAGEFYTPQPVSTLLAKIVTSNNKNLKSVYDPTCGSGSLLLRVKREANKVDKIYGQELNRTTYNLARMNMILHDVHYADFDIRQEDTLEHPQHRDLRFDAIVANPPFSVQWSASQLHMSDDRFSVYGKLAPSSKADMAFVQHMVYHLAEDGCMAVVLPHGVLYRGGAEGHIRQYLIEQMNCLDAVIGLPENIFYGTSIPTCVLVFKKCRKNPDDILFIDASQHFDKVKTQNILRPEHIEKIIDAYKNRTNKEKYSHIATLADIKTNDYNLNIPRYVDTFEADESVDLEAVVYLLGESKKKIIESDLLINKYCKELNIPFPDGYNIHLLQQYKKGVMQQIFSQDLRFRDEDGSEFPEWKVCRMGELYSFQTTNSFSRDNLNYDIGNVKNIHYGDIHTKFATLFDITKEVVPFINPEVSIGKISESNYCQEGDLIFADASEDLNDVGKSIELVNLNNEKLLSGLHTILARPRSNEFSKGFAGYLFKSSNIRLQIQKVSQGSKVLSISATRLSNINLFIPVLKEQAKIANFLTALDDKITQTQAERDAVKQYKQGLLQ